MTVEHSPETKSADMADAFGEFMNAFEAFKDTNDRRLAEIETRMGADVLTVEKVDRISAALDEQKRALDAIAVKAARPALSPAERTEVPEGRRAFHAYVRHGDERALRTLSHKAMSAGTPGDGGYLVPAETEAEIGRRLSALSPIRAIAMVRQVSGSVLKKPFAVSGPATGWVGETEARPQTGTSTLAELTFPTMELYAMPAATATLLDDAAVDIDAWISAEVEAAFAEQESAAFVNGDGINKPKGFLAGPTVDDDAWSWGNLGYKVTGVAGGLPASDPADVLIDLTHSLTAGYRQNANFVMNRKTQAAFRKLKDADGNYLWVPPAVAGAKAFLSGFPVVEVEDMPDMAANSLAVAFGDFQRGYLVVDRAGVNVLRDPYSAKPYVLFYVTKRVGGGVQDFSAIKLLKFGTA